MKKKNAVEVLTFLERLLTAYLEELKECKETDENLFEYGEKIAYVECLEVIQRWDSSAYDTAEDVERRFPI